MHVRVVYYDYATEEQPYCNTNTSCPRLPYHCLTRSLRYTHFSSACLQLLLSSAPLGHTLPNNNYTDIRDGRPMCARGRWMSGCAILALGSCA
eukprot:COSAG01_NODE_5746_length_4061_cov_324.385411_3_plen_93_part_00